LQGCFRAEQARWEEARDLIQESIRIDRENNQPLETRFLRVRMLAQLALRAKRNQDAIKLCRQVLQTELPARLSLSAAALLARAGDRRAAVSAIPSGLPQAPPKGSLDGLPPEARKWPKHWRLIVHVWAEMALADGDGATAYRLLRSAPPVAVPEEWPELLVRAAIAAGEVDIARQYLHSLATRPGGYWVAA